MSVGNGIAIAGIWIGIGIASFNVSSNTLITVTLLGLIGTIIAAST